jgi:hypothetical protein
VVVPKNTTVHIRVINSSNLETTQFVTVNDAVPAPDFFKALGTPLLPAISAITINSRSSEVGGATFEDNEQ